MILSLEDEFRNGKTVFDKEIREKLAFRVPGGRDIRDNKLLVQQHPEEAHCFLEWLRDNNIKNYLEVGVSKGGFLCLVHQYLRSRFDDIFCHGVDIENNLSDYKEYHSFYPDCVFEIVDSNWIPDRNYDFIFIDNNLHFQHMNKELIKLRPFSKYIGLHDIIHGRWGAKRFWKGHKQKIKDWKVVEEINFDRGPGIGILEC